MTIKAILKGLPNSKGEKTITIRVSTGKVRRFHATKMKVRDKDFSSGMVKSSHPKSVSYNASIQRRINEILAGEAETPDLSFKEYAVACLNEWDKSKRVSTLSQMSSKLRKFLEFRNLKLSDVTSDQLKKYVEHCYKLGNQSNTVWTSLKFVRVIMNKAYKEKLIKENPFHYFQMPRYRDPEKHFLTKDQVNTIEEKIKTLPKEYQVAGGWFLISCYTGLRYGDQSKFDKKQIRGGRLIIYTSKTGQPVSIKMNDKLTSLFKLVDFKAMPYTNEHYNRILKAIGVVCEIEEKLTVHVARHTFGTLCASAGISQEVTAKLMGHSSIRTTAIYYQLTADRLDSEMGKLF